MANANLEQYGAFDPSADLTETEKDEKWYMGKAMFYLRKSFANGFNYNQTKMNKAATYHMGTQTGQEYNFLQTNEDGSVYPAIWANLNTAAIRINSLVNERRNRDYESCVETINASAKSKYLDYRSELLAAHATKGDFQQLEAVSGIPTVTPQQSYIPEDGDMTSFEDYIKKSYKDVAADTMEAIIEWIRIQYNLDIWEQSSFMDALVYGKCVNRNEVIDGVSRPVKYDPRRHLYDPWAKGDYMLDSTFHGVWDYSSIYDVKQKFNLSDSEFDSIKNKSFSSLGFPMFSNYNATSGTLSFGDTILNLYDNLDTRTERVFVAELSFKDIKKEKYVEKTDPKTGKKYLTRTTRKNLRLNEGEERFVEKDSQTWRKVTLIGGHIVKDFGVDENIVRPVDNISLARSSFQVYCHGWNDGTWSSIYDKIMPIMDKINVAHYKIETEISKHVGKVLYYDISQVPELWTHGEVIKELKTSGIVFYDSNKEGIPNNNIARDGDMGLSESITQFLNLFVVYENMIDKITGINETRLGQLKGSSQGLGVTQQAQAQSVMSTEGYNQGFDSHFGFVLNHLANQAKFMAFDREVLSMILGDNALDFLDTDSDLTLYDYGVNFYVRPKLLSNEQVLTEMVTGALQQGVFNTSQGARGFLFATKLLTERDKKKALLDFETILDRMDKEQRQKDEAAAQQQQAAQSQAQQQAIQQQAENARIENEAKGTRQSELSAQNAQQKSNQIVLSEGLKQTT